MLGSVCACVCVCVYIYIYIYIYILSLCAFLSGVGFRALGFGV